LNTYMSIGSWKSSKEKGSFGKHFVAICVSKFR
jgi:hypothetical protein